MVPFFLARGRGSKIVKEMLKEAPTTDAEKFAEKANARLEEEAIKRYGEADSAKKRAFLSEQRRHVRSAKSDINAVVSRFSEDKATEKDIEYLDDAVQRDMKAMRDTAWERYMKSKTAEQQTKIQRKIADETLTGRAGSLSDDKLAELQKSADRHPDDPRSLGRTAENFIDYGGSRRRQMGLAMKTWAPEERERYEKLKEMYGILNGDSSEAALEKFVQNDPGLRRAFAAMDRRLAKLKKDPEHQRKIAEHWKRMGEQLDKDLDLGI